MLTLAYMPLEENIVSIWNPLFTISKMTFAFLVLCVPVLGFGMALMRIFRVPQAASREQKNSLWQGFHYFLLSGLAGVIAIGLLTFMLGGIFSPSRFLGYGICAVGIMLFLGNGHSFSLADKAKLWWYDLDPATKWLWRLWLLALCIKLVSAFMYQQHGDPYSYNLSATDRWLRTSFTGLDLTDIHTGYALAVEHFYLFLRIVTVGHSEQYIVGTLFHVVFGYGTFLAATLHLSSKFLSSRALAFLSLFLLQSTFTYYAWQPRNDAFLAGAMLSGVTGILVSSPGVLILAAACTFVIKAPGPVTFVSLGLTSLILHLRDWRTKKFLNLCVWYLVAAGCMILFWLPFAWHNYRITGNPLFPLLNEVFKSPFAPSGFGNVIDDMQPLKLTFAGFFRGLKNMLASQWLYALGFAVALIGVARKKFLAVPAEVKFLGVFTFINAWLVQVATREYSVDFASRFVIVVLTTLSVLSIYAITNIKSKFPVRMVFIVLLGICVARLGIDVSIKKAWEFFKIDNQTQNICERQPILALNRALTDYIRSENLDRQKVLSLGSNLSFFLTNAEFWHATKTYPMWSWPLATMSAQDWREKLALHHIQFVIVPPKDSAAKQHIMQLDHKVLYTKHQWSLLRIN